jgi:hypothetical protein
MTNAAERQRRARERRRHGLAIYRVVADEVAVEEVLVRAGWLSEHDRDDRAAVEAALSHVIALLAALPVTRDDAVPRDRLR